MMTPLQRLKRSAGAWSMTPCANRQMLYWNYDLGVGFLPSTGYEYSDAYWDKYVKMSKTKLGRALTDARVGFIREHAPGLLVGAAQDSRLCDVGIGSGQFVLSAGCWGADVNPHAVEWLVGYGRQCDPTTADLDALSFWDVLEHIEDPTPLLSRVCHVFMSVPVHEDLHGCLESKHLRPDEHLWHFTHEGVERFMSWFGFKLVAWSDVETRLGREGINTYYFRR